MFKSPPGGLFLNKNERKAYNVKYVTKDSATSKVSDNTIGSFHHSSWFKVDIVVRQYAVNAQKSE